MSDRTVHVEILLMGGGHIEIVRYDRSGKWFYEDKDRPTLRRRLTLAEAAEFARLDRPAVIWHEGRLGGRAFDAAVRRLRGGQQ